MIKVPRADITLLAIDAIVNAAIDPAQPGQ